MRRSESATGKFLSVARSSRHQRIELLERRLFFAASISGFELINADTDQPIQTLTNGATLNLSTLPTTNLNVRAIAGSNELKSVRFKLDSRTVRIESVEPYALFADDTDGDYHAGAFALGKHRLEATP